MNKLIGLFLVAVLALSSWVAYHFTHKQPPVDNTPAISSPAVSDVGKEEIKPDKVQVYKQEAKDKLPLPQKVKDDKTDHVISASQTPDDDHKHTVTTIINSDTGEATTFDHKEPLPWLAVEKKNELRIDYGYKGNPYPQPVARLSYKVDIIQVKALHLGVNVSLDVDGEYFIGGGIGWKF